MTVRLEIGLHGFLCSHRALDVGGASITHRFAKGLILIALAWACLMASGVWLGASGQSLPSRVVSLNVCTDHLMLALARREQIAALSRFSRDPGFSVASAEARRYRVLRGTSEEVLEIKPDLVLASTFTSPELLATLRRFAIPVIAFSPAITVVQGRADILRLGQLLGRERQSEELVARIDAALARGTDVVRPLHSVRGRRLSVLQLQRRLFVSGEATLIGDVLSQLGMTNVARDLGITSVGRTSLEAILKLRPDVLIVDANEAQAHDQGEAALFHPALLSHVPPGRRIAIDPRFFICAGPTLPDGLMALAEGLARAGSSKRAEDVAVSGP